MTFWQQWLSTDFAQRLGWTLLHSSWQGALIWAILVALLVFLKGRSAQIRYGICCIALAAMIIVPVVTFCLRETPAIPTPPAPSPPVLFVHSASTPPDAPSSAKISPGIAPPVLAPTPAFEKTKHPEPLWSNLNHGVQPFMPYVVSLWLIGAGLIALWHTTGWLIVRRRYLRGTLAPPHAIELLLTKLAARFSVTATLRLSARALSPMVIGMIRPVILLPAGLVSGLSPDQLEAILAHELAHIRRHDYLVNIFQELVETLLFHHPAVWWISRQIRREREHCCDDRALAITSNRIAYVKALAAVAELSPAALPALGATGGDLLARIRRITGDHRSSHVTWMGATLSALILAGVLCTAVSTGRRALAGGTGSPATLPATKPEVKYLTVTAMIQQAAAPSHLSNMLNLSGEESELRARMDNMQFKPAAADEPALLAAMNDPNLDFTARLCVAGYLLDLKNESARKFLLPLLEGSDPKSIQESAHTLLFHARPNDPNDWATDEIIRNIVNDHLMKARGYFEVYEHVASLKIKRAEPQLIAALKRNYYFQPLAEAVAAFDDEPAQAAILATLESPNGKDIYLFQAAFLEEHHYPDLAKTLVRHLDDTQGIISMLCHLDDKSILPQLRDYLLKHPNTENAGWVRIAIARLESPDKKTMIARLGQMLDDTGDPYILGVLRETKDPAIIPPIMRLLKKSKDMGPMMDGVFALEAVEGTQSVRALVELLDLNLVDDGTKQGKPMSPFVLNDWIFRALEKKTGQKFGNDKQKWRDYVDKLPPVVDQSTPKAGMLAVLDAVASGDVTAVRQCIYAKPEHGRFADDWAEMMVVGSYFQRAIDHHFPGKAIDFSWNMFTDARIADARKILPKATADIQGDHAKLIPPADGGNNEESLLLTPLYNDHGHWKLDLETDPDLSDYPPKIGGGNTSMSMIYFIHDSCPVLLTIAADIEAGKYTTFEQVEKATDEASSALYEKSYEKLAREPINRGNPAVTQPH